MVRFTQLEEGENRHAVDRDAGGRDGREAILKERDMLAFRELCSDIEDVLPGSTKGEGEENLYQGALAYCRDMFSRVHQNVPIDLNAGHRIIRAIVAASVDNALLSTALHCEDESNFVIRHSANVAVYAIKMAAELGFNRENQVEIGMSGLVHEVGKCEIPEEILHKEGQLNEEELRIVREAPNHGYEILKSLGKEHAHLAECCLQTYERIDGSGYPKGLRGDEIHEYARIIGLVDVYEALTHRRPQRERFLHFSAVKEILRSAKSAFQKNHLKAFLKAFSLFPLHTHVKLNSLAIGRVIEAYPDRPMRPKLQIVRDAHGRRAFQEEVLDLSEAPFLYIVGASSEEEAEDLHVFNK